MKNLIPAVLVALAASTALADFNTGTQAGPFASNGLNGNAANGLFSFNAGHSGLFNAIRIRGDAEYNNSGTYRNELRYSILTDSGARASGELIAGGVWSGFQPVDNSQNFTPFQLTGGNSYTIRLWESYDDGGAGVIDAYWHNLQFDFTSAVINPPACTNLGTLASANDINTFGSLFDTEIALFDSNGLLLADNDDAGGLQSQIQTGGLLNGNYYIAVGGFNTTFGDFWTASPGGANGDYTLTIDGSTVASSTLASGTVHWYCFTIPTPGSAMLLGMGGLVALRRRR